MGAANQRIVAPLSPHLLALVLASAALHAVWNAALKHRADPGAAGVWVVLGAASISAVLAVVTGDWQLAPASLPWTLAAGLVEGVYFASLLTAMHHLPLPLAYGVSRGAGVLLAWPIAMVLMGELASPQALVGAGLLSLGLASVALERSPVDGSARRKQGWLATWICAASIAAYPLVYKQALHTGAAPFALFAVSLGLSLPIQLGWLGPTRMQRLRSEARLAPYVLAWSALLCAASFLLLLWALREGGAAHLSALRNTSVLVATALAARWQRPTPMDWVRAVLVTVGAVLVGW